MGISSRIGLVKDKWRLAVRLLGLRLKIVQLDWQEYQTRWLSVLISVCLLTVLLFLGVLSLLFALQAALPAQYALWTFAGAGVVCLGAAGYLYVRVMRQAEQQKEVFSRMLEGFSEDLEMLRGEFPAEDLPAPVKEDSHAS